MGRGRPGLHQLCVPAAYLKFQRPARHHATKRLSDWIRNNRNEVEGRLAWLNDWHAVATRYEETAVCILGVVNLAAALDWIKR